MEVRLILGHKIVLIQYMAAPKGNQNAKGKATGRKSMYEELARAQALADMYYNDQDQATIEKKIEKGKFSIRDRHMLNAMEGDQAAISPIFAKLHPDKMQIKDDASLKLDV